MEVQARSQSKVCCAWTHIKFITASGRTLKFNIQLFSYIYLFSIKQDLTLKKGGATRYTGYMTARPIR